MAAGMGEDGPMTATADSLPDLVSLKVDVDGHVAEVTLLGPSKGNAMTSALRLPGESS